MCAHTYIILALSTKNSKNSKVMSSLSSKILFFKISNLAYFLQKKGTRILGEMADSRAGKKKVLINLDHFIVSKG